jgi:hypothetical protein
LQGECRRKEGIRLAVLRSMVMNDFWHPAEGFRSVIQRDPTRSLLLIIAEKKASEVSFGFKDDIGPILSENCTAS